MKEVKPETLINFTLYQILSLWERCTGCNDVRKCHICNQAVPGILLGETWSCAAMGWTKVKENAMVMLRSKNIPFVCWFCCSIYIHLATIFWTCFISISHAVDLWGLSCCNFELSDTVVVIPWRSDTCCVLRFQDLVPSWLLSFCR